MGSQSSKEKKNEAPSKSPSGEISTLAASPSLSKSDTKESSRSFRGSIRSKIPGTGKTDSPRTSLSDIPRGSTSELSRNSSGDNNTPSIVTSPADDDSDEKDRVDGISKPRSSSEPSMPREESSARPSIDGLGESPQPPPSPTISPSVGQGHSSIDRAQKSGEVGTVSDAPPSGAIHPSHNQKAGDSILIKSNYLPPPPPKSRSRSKSREKKKESPTDGSMDIGTLKEEDLDEMIQRLLDAGYAGKVTKTVCLKNAEIEAVCRAARELFLSQPSLLELSPPVKIVGDVHGQYTDLLRMFEMCGFPPNANFLFLGDYVDRGKQSLETILLLLCYKLKFPENFFLLRGNHESANVTRVYGFYDECKRRTTIKIWKTFVDVFNALPIASIVANKIFCVHGGLSPALSHMDDIRQIARPTDVPDYGLLNDLLWSDPAEMDADWEANERGVSYCFGKKVIMEFLAKHDFDLVCRAHMVVEDGYEFFTDRILVTVFSAPNYCGEFDNWGAVMSVSGELLCSFELLKPLDSSALKSHIKKGRKERQNMLNSPPASQYPQSY